MFIFSFQLAQILGNNESFEPYTSNIYNRRVLSGEFQVVNHHLIKDLTEIGMWDDDMKNEVIAEYGSIQNITRIPQEIRDLYKTVWEISVKTTMNMAADRGAFIDQSQSFNLHVAQPTYAKMSSMHFYAWKLGLKTGMYYLRTRPAANPIQFTVDKKRLAASRLLNKTTGSVNSTTQNGTSHKQNGSMQENGNNYSMNENGNEIDPPTAESSTADLDQQMAAMVCSLDNKDECMMCGS